MLWSFVAASKRASNVGRSYFRWRTRWTACGICFRDGSGVFSHFPHSHQVYSDFCWRNSNDASPYLIMSSFYPNQIDNQSNESIDQESLCSTNGHAQRRLAEKIFFCQMNSPSFFEENIKGTSSLLLLYWPKIEKIYRGIGCFPFADYHRSNQSIDGSIQCWTVPHFLSWS